MGYFNPLATPNTVENRTIRCYFNPIPTGNTNLIYSLIRSKVVFYQLANLPEDSYLLLSPHARNTSQSGVALEGGEGAEHRTNGVCVSVCVSGGCGCLYG